MILTANLVILVVVFTDVQVQDQQIIKVVQIKTHYHKIVNNVKMVFIILIMFANHVMLVVVIMDAQTQDQLIVTAAEI